MHFRAIYIGTPGVDAPPSADAFLGWIGSSSYWAILAQYGVDDATYDGPTSLTTAQVFPDGMIQNGLDAVCRIKARVHDLIHADEAERPLPTADAYAFFLPDNVNIDSGQSGGRRAHHVRHVFPRTTRNDGTEPYAVLPPCADGRSTASISHEAPKVATDPILQEGWSSDDPQDIKTSRE